MSDRYARDVLAVTEATHVIIKDQANALAAESRHPTGPIRAYTQVVCDDRVIGALATRTPDPQVETSSSGSG
jgi:hypothetical protein